MSNNETVLIYEILTALLHGTPSRRAPPGVKLP